MEIYDYFFIIWKYSRCYFVTRRDNWPVHNDKNDEYSKAY